MYNANMNILLLEDDIALNRAISKVLQLDNHYVTPFIDGLKVMHGLENHYDLYILDINVPHVTGLELLEIILAHNPHAKVMIISSNTDLHSLEKAYGIGCVDYIKKPFHIAEIRAKINRLDIPLTPINEKIKLKPGVEHLTKKEKRLLQLLLHNAGEVVSYSMIEQDVYTGKPMSMDALRALVRRLRNKLAEDIIRNVLDEGYTIPRRDTDRIQEHSVENSSDMHSLQKENMLLRAERDVLMMKSITDPLTGLYNRSKVEEVFLYEQQRFMHYGDPLSVIIIDLDNFKQVNDQYGHNIGDRYLKRFSRTLHDFFRSVDIIGRWGGEEFIILLPGTSRPEAKAWAKKLQERIKQMECPTVGSRTASFGIATLQKDDTLHTLIERADKALLQAKAEGKDRIRIYEGEKISV